MTRILVCGSRYWTDDNTIRKILKKYPTSTTIIHGGCRGVDNIAGRIARELGMKVDVFPAQWNKYGRSAGPKRNEKMLKEGKPDLVLVFHEDIANSKGSWDMLNRVIKTGVPYKIFTM